MFHFELSHLISEIDSESSIPNEKNSCTFPIKRVQSNHHQFKTEFAAKSRITKISPGSGNIYLISIIYIYSYYFYIHSLDESIFIFIALL